MLADRKCPSWVFFWLIFFLSCQSEWSCLNFSSDFVCVPAREVQELEGDYISRLTENQLCIRHFFWLTINIDKWLIGSLM